MSTDYASTQTTLDAGRESSSTRFVRTLLEQADIALNGDQPWDMKIYNIDVPRRALAHGNLGLGEAYMDGEWSSDELDEFFARLLRSGVVDQVSPTALLFHSLKARYLNKQAWYAWWLPSRQLIYSTNSLRSP